MWKHKESKWLVRGGRKVRCYLCGKKILAKGDLFLFHGDTGYYSHQSCQAESTTISGNERRKAVKKIAVGAAVVGAIAAGAGKLIDISSQSKGSNSPDTQTILTSQGLIPPALTSDPSNPVPGQMWYRSDAGVEAHFDGVQNRVVYSSEINDGNVHVTSKGIVNGLSVLPNDGTGWFGPDTTKGATAPGQYGSPYTETSGIAEGADYVHNLGGGAIELINVGVTYDIYEAITIYQDTTIIGNYSILNYYASANNLIFSIAAVSNPNHIIRDLTINVKQAPSGGLTSIATGTTMNKLQEYENVTINANSLAQIGFNFSNGSNSGCINCYVTDVTEYAYYASGGTGMFFDNCSYSGASQADGSYTFYWGGGDTLRINGGRTENGSGLIWIDSTNNTCTQARISRAECDAAEQPIMFQIGNNDIVQIVFEDLLITAPTKQIYSITTNSGATGYLTNITVNSGIYLGAGEGFLALYNAPMNGSTFTVNNAIIIDNNTGGNTNTGEFNNSFITGNIVVNNCIIVPSSTDVLARAPSSTYSITFNNCTLTGTWSNPVVGNVILNKCLNPPQTPPTLATNPPVSGTAYQNTNPYDIRLKIPVTYSPTSSAAATLATGTSTSSTVTTSTKVSYPAGITTGIVETYEMVVKAGQYFELVVTNATIGTVEVQAA